MNASVVTCSVTHKATMGRLLDCLSKQSLLPKEIILIEAGQAQWSPEEFPPTLRERIKVRYAPGESLAASRQRGQEAATNDIVIYLDDDLIIPDTYIETALNYLDQYPSIMAVGGIYHDKALGRRSKWSLCIGRIFGMYGDGSRNRLLPSSWADYVRGDATSHITSADWLFGCNSAVRRSAFSMMGVGYETRLQRWSYLEDVWFYTRLRRHWGDCVRILPELAVIHDPVSSAGHLTPKTLRMRIIYRHLFWREELQRCHFFRYCLGQLANLLLMIKIERKSWVVTEVLKAHIFCLRHPDMNWEQANGFIFSGN